MKITKFDYKLASNPNTAINKFRKSFNEKPLLYKMKIHYRVAFYVKWQIIKYSVKNFLMKHYLKAKALATVPQE